MTNIVDGKKFQEKYIFNTLKRLETEITYLNKWMTETFPKFNIEVDVEFSKIRRTLIIRTRLYTDTKQRIVDKDSFMNFMKIEERTMMNSNFMDQFLRVVNEKFREEITRIIGNYRHLELLELEYAG